MRISDWSSDVCSSDLHLADTGQGAAGAPTADEIIQPLAGEITHDLGGGGVAVIGRIGRVVELLGQKPAVFLGQLAGTIHHAGAARRSRGDRKSTRLNSSN